MISIIFVMFSAYGPIISQKIAKVNNHLAVKTW